MDILTLQHLLSKLSCHRSPLLGQRNRQLGTVDGYRQAAVLLAIVRQSDEWQILLTKRADTLRRHTGQIAFAGGARDPDDASLTATALREAHEEIGTPPAVWQTFPDMQPCYTPSGYIVHAIPALAEQPPALRINTAEVAEVFYLPLSYALDLNNYRQRSIRHQDSIRTIPALPFRHYDIWGLTAMLLYTLAECHADTETTRLSG